MDSYQLTRFFISWTFSDRTSKRVNLYFRVIFYQRAPVDAYLNDSNLENLQRKTRTNSERVSSPDCAALASYEVFPQQMRLRFLEKYLAGRFWESFGDFHRDSIS